MRTLDQVIEGLSEDQRARVEAKAKRLIKAETLRQLRAAVSKTQEEVAQASGTSQYNVSRLESRSDMLLSTLDEYVAGLGGQLHLVAEFPGKRKIEIALKPRRRYSAG
jgi:transcriptional regulator with XRE-family HTH domain